MSIQFKQIIDRVLGILLIIPHVVITRILGMLLRRDHSLQKSPDAILVVKILGLGSMIMAMDSIAAIRKKYPNAKMILLCSKGLVEGIRPANLFDEYWYIEDHSFFKWLLSSLQVLLRSWQIKTLWTLDLEIYSKLTTLFTLWTLAINRFGFQLKSTHFRNFLNTHNEYFNHFCSVSENFTHLVKRMNVHVEGTYPFPEFLPQKRGEEHSKPFIAINNTCSELAYVRQLPNAKLASLSRWLLQNTNYQVAFCGAPGDRLMNEQFIDEHLVEEFGKERILNLAGRYRLQDFYSFLYAKCAIMISIDSAPLHIARKLGLPTLSFWGPTNPLNYLEIKEGEAHRHRYHYLGVHCSPCIHHTMVLPCGGNNFCMQDMEEQKIMNLTSQMIEELQPNRV